MTELGGEPNPDLRLSTKDLAKADRDYAPFPNFDQWPQALHTYSWGQASEELRDARLTVDDEAANRAIGIAIRSAAVETGAIEGLYEVDRGVTYAVAVQAAAWEAIMEARTDRFPEFFQAQLAAYDLVLDAATRKVPISEALIRRVHEIVCGPQETYRVLTDQGFQEHRLLKGRYKTQPNHVRQPDGSIHAYAPVDQVAPEMHRLVETLASDAFEAAHPLLQSSYVHYALTAIHPFADGNGRVARSITSVYLYRAAGIPFLVFSDERAPYFGALSAADQGDVTSFIDFVEDRAVGAMRLVADQMALHVAEDPEVLVARFRSLLTTPAGLTHFEVDQAGKRLLERALEEVRGQLAQLVLPQGVSASTGNGTGIGAEPEPDGYRQLLSADRPYAQLHLKTEAPAGASVTRTFEVLASVDETARSAFLLRARESPRTASFSVRDIHPEFSAVLSLRLAAFIRVVISDALAELLDQASRALRKSGFSRD